MGGWIMKGIKKLLGLGLALTLSLGMVACSSSGITTNKRFRKVSFSN